METALKECLLDEKKMFSFRSRQLLVLERKASENVSLWAFFITWVLNPDRGGSSGGW